MRGAGVDVLVVGAGIAGLAVAARLHEWGANVDVVERAGGPSVIGAGIYLPANAVRALDTLGLAGQVAARGVRIMRQRVSDHTGRELFSLDVEEIWDGVGPCLAVHRSELHEVLLAGAKAVSIRWGRSPVSIVDTADGVRVVFDDGTSGGYDLVIGADGVHSAVRETVFGPSAAARPVGQVARRFVASSPSSDPVWSLMMGRGSVFLTIPIGDGRVYCYSDGPVAGYAAPVPALLDLAVAPHTAPVEEVDLPRWSRGMVLLVGDAAHATSPNMAEGAAMALEDAIVLADALTESRTLAVALTSFEERRRPRTGWVLAQTRRRDRLRVLPAGIRNAVLARAGRKIFVRNYAPLREWP
ncbi:FAD-dependent monooxygenase [Virgisporangium aurantiacum]|uniref:FAD-dependent oxidoreductase n=1 Tax=Virgisporangium aurantiacum TaxID=175570 RepID=A0A8J3Z3E8_9ACTN|nr:FAD-dependent monooxygenase [Virgisporangium aurantiacum]GIJ55982.1 FAD-dependent oxidoreductase [Virgisporangium aurantiacum]